ALLGRYGGGGVSHLSWAPVGGVPPAGRHRQIPPMTPTGCATWAGGHGCSLKTQTILKPRTYPLATRSAVASANRFTRVRVREITAPPARRARSNRRRRVPLPPRWLAARAPAGPHVASGDARSGRSTSCARAA